MTRRQGLELAASGSFGFLADHLKAPELQAAPTPGTLIETPRNSYLYKQELRGGKLVIVGYRTTPLWKFNNGFKGPIRSSTESAVAGSSIPILEIPKEGSVEFWDGYFRYSTGDWGGIREVTVPGLFSSSFDNTFDYLLQRVGPDFVLPATYKIDEKGTSLGVPYEKEDTMQRIEKSADNIIRIIHLWKQQDPLARIVIRGHSLGGQVGLRVTQRHTDTVAAFLAYDGAMMGADLSILPGYIEGGLARAFGGESAQQLIELGANPNTPRMVQAQIVQLTAAGIFTGFWASTDDDIVTPTYALAGKPSIELEGRKIDFSYSMGSWFFWDGAHSSLATLGCTPANPYICLLPDFDSPTEDSSATLRRTGIYVGAHGGPLKNRRVREDSDFILDKLFPTYENIRFEEQASAESLSKRFIFGKTTEQELLNNDPLGRLRNLNGSIVYFFPSTAGAEKPDEAILRNGVVVFEKVYINQDSKTPGPFQESKRSLARQGFYETLPANSYNGAVIYLFAARGIAAVGNPTNGSFFEVHSFASTTVEDYIEQFGENVKLF